jgi:hypothetical protein
VAIRISGGVALRLRRGQTAARELVQDLADPAPFAPANSSTAAATSGASVTVVLM